MKRVKRKFDSTRHLFLSWDSPISHSVWFELWEKVSSFVYYRTGQESLRDKITEEFLDSPRRKK